MDHTVTLERLRAAAGDLLSVAPNIAAAAATLIIGYAVARIVRSVLVRLLQSTKVFGERTGAPGEPSAATIGTFMFYFIMLLFILASFNVLNLSLTDAIVNTITALPIVAAASGTLVRTLSASMLVISGAVLVILFAWVLARLLLFFSVKAVGGVRSRSAKARLAHAPLAAGARTAPRYKNENDAALDLIKGFIQQTGTEPEEPARRMPAGGARRETDAAALSREPAAETDSARQADKPYPPAHEKAHPAVRRRPGRMLLIEAAKYDDYQPAAKPDVREAAAKPEARRPSAKAAAAAPLKSAKAALRRTAGAAKPASPAKSAAAPAKPASPRAKPAAPPAKQPKVPAKVKPASAPAKPKAASAVKPVPEPAKPAVASKKSTSGGPRLAAAGRHLEEALREEPARPTAPKKSPKGRGLR